MNDRQHYREQLDACRPGSDDLSLPGLADLARAVESDRALAQELERSQQFDRAVAAAMHDLPVPEGLKQKLLDRIAQIPAGEDEPDSSSVLPSAATVDLAKPAVSVPEARPSRRLWLRTVTGLAAAAMLAGLAVWMWPRPQPEVTADQLAERASAWMTQVSPEGNWTPLPATPAEFPQSKVQVQPTHQQPFRTAEGWPGTAYRSVVGRATVTVFVFPAPRANVRLSGASYTELSASRGRSMAAWQSDGKLYVAVVEGPGLRLEDVIRRPLTA